MPDTLVLLLLQSGKKLTEMFVLPSPYVGALTGCQTPGLLEECEAGLLVTNVEQGVYSSLSPLGLAAGICPCPVYICVCGDGDGNVGRWPEMKWSVKCTIMFLS